MVFTIISVLLSFMAGIALMGALTFALSAALLWPLQLALYARGLRQGLSAMRRRQYNDRGLDPRKRRLRHQADEEALQLISGGSSISRAAVPRLTLELRFRIEHAFECAIVLPDVRDEERLQIKTELLERADRLESQWRIVQFGVCLSAALAVATLFQCDAFRIFEAIRSGVWLLPDRVWPYGIAYFYDGFLQISHLLGVLITAGTSAAVATVLIGRAGAASDRGYAMPPAVPPDEVSSSACDSWETEKGVVGRPNQPIRAINFSSGGFDALMQLGVIQALVVIQGRAPDAVVGLSIGAINAAALAEVLQAGEEAERSALRNRSFADLPHAEAAQIQAARLRARVKRLREYIEAAQRAPERLLDALLPDAYQIDDAQPLVPLQQPRFAADERRERGDFVAAKTGLARLYNHLLDVPLSLGTLAKATRRILGVIASAEITSFTRRWAIRLTDGMRLWLALGLNLVSMSTLVPIVFGAYRKRHPKPLPGTAATLIFRSRFLAGLRRFVAYVLSFVVLYLLWVVGSLFALLLYALVAIGIWVRTRFEQADPDVRGVLLDAWQGLIGWTLVTLAWTLVPLFIATSINPFTDLRFGEALALAASEWRWMAIGVAAIFLTLLAASLVVIQRTRGHPQDFRERLLASYDLGEAIFREHGLRTYVTELFDPAFYRKPSMDAAVEAALKHQYVTPAAGAGRSRLYEPKTVSHYHSAERLPGERIHVGLAVANTERSSLEIVPAEARLVDGLMAATAITPFLPPVELEVRFEGVWRKRLYIDGSNVSREPTHALLKLLRERRDAHHGPIYIYSVTPFPVSKPEADSSSGLESTRKGHYLDLIDIAWRAWRLQRFRDASLERRLTHLITGLIPEQLNAIKPRIKPGIKPRDSEKTFLRVWVTPIELDRDADVNRRIWSADKEERRRMIEEAIADGCRAALQVMLPHALPKDTTVKCRWAVKQHFKKRELSKELGDLRFPGSETGRGSGIPEICQRCSLNPAGRRHGDDAEDERQALRLGDWEPPFGPSWPHERERAEVNPAPMDRFRRPTPPHRKELDRAWEKYKARAGGETWPRVRMREGKEVSGNARPTVSLLFSGGVFRGVFQVGVLNGLSEIGLKPDLIAGASVGSITAAMIARAFSTPTETARAVHIARIAAAYLSIDRMILTDRFADAVRNLTLRAAETRFSVRQADRVFRKFDYPTFFEFDRNTRRVLAGLERLLYITPYQLNDLVRTARTRDNRRAIELIVAGVQQLLDRMEIGEEALGAEALRELVDQYAIKSKGGEGSALSFTTDQLREQHGIQFLATTTNLTDGRLEVIGEWPESEDAPGTLLEQALLASSAFPAVFRPRWSWELTAGAPRTAQYIDGGVMDNLPIDAIARFLDRAGRLKMIRRFPESPHLIVAASLQVQAPTYSTDFIRRRMKRSWLVLRRRASQLNYNTKLDAYEFAEDAMREIREHVRDTDPALETDGASQLVGIQLLPIKPNWLCGTFAFHPMLGFRREKQARSIAHGCATTLLQFAERRFDPKTGEERLKNWGVDLEALPLKAETWSRLLEQAKKRRRPERDGMCWLRDRPCPFSRKALSRHELGLEQAVIDAVSVIHRTCSEAETHLRVV